MYNSSDIVTQFYTAFYWTAGSILLFFALLGFIHLLSKFIKGGFHGEKENHYHHDHHNGHRRTRSIIVSHTLIVRP